MFFIAIDPIFRIYHISMSCYFDRNWSHIQDCQKNFHFMFCWRYWSHIQAFQELPVHVCLKILIPYSSFPNIVRRMFGFLRAPPFPCKWKRSMAKPLSFPKSIFENQSRFSWDMWIILVYPKSTIIGSANHENYGFSGAPKMNPNSY